MVSYIYFLPPFFQIWYRWRILFFFFESSLVIQGLLFLKIVTVLMGNTLSAQKDMYEDTVSTCSLMLLEGARRLSQPVDQSIPAELQCCRWSSAWCVWLASLGKSDWSKCIWNGSHRIYLESFPSGWCRWLIDEILSVTCPAEQWLKLPRTNLGESWDMSFSLFMWSMAVEVFALGWM